MCSILRTRTDLRLPETNNRLKIILSDSGLEIIAPKALIRSKSMYFDDACSEQDQTNLSQKHEGRPESQNRPEVANTVRLRHINANIFSIFLAWAVTGTLEEAEQFIADACESKERTCSKTLQLIECYILGERIRAEDFKNGVIDQILTNEKSLLYDFRASSLVGHVIDCIYHNTPVQSPLRRFIVDLTISTKPKDLASLIPNQSPNVEYLRDCFREYQGAMCMSRESLRNPWEKHGCDYHDHSDRPLGYRCRK